MATHQPAWAQRPLPPGWEAKYDQRSRKYFFINHHTKNTSWVDPRIAYYGSQPSPAMMHRPAPEQIPMQPYTKPKCRTCKTNEVTMAGQECRQCRIKAQQREAALVRAREEQEAAQKRREQEERIKQEQERIRVRVAQNRSPVRETSFGVDVGEDDHGFDTAPQLTMAEKIKLVNDLGEIYSDVTRTVIDMVLESCQYKKETAASILNSMSSKKASQAASTSKSTAANKRAVAFDVAWSNAASSKTTAANKRTAFDIAWNNKKAASPKKSAQPTAAEKARARDALQKSFPSATANAITIALETTKYDQTKAAAVLRMLKDDTKGKKTTSSAPSGGSTALSSTAPSKVVTTTITISSAPDKAKKSVDDSKPKPVSVKARVKAAAPEVKSTEFTSAHSVMAKGRDPSLAKGPNKDLLIDNYVHEGGPDVTLRHGPDPSNVIGPSQVLSKTSSLASGPQASLRNGPQPGLAKGSLYQGDRQS